VKTREETQRKKEMIASSKKKDFRRLEKGLDRCMEASRK
jgi:hypothetical protein